MACRLGFPILYDATTYTKSSQLRDRNECGGGLFGMSSLMTTKHGGDPW